MVQQKVSIYQILGEGIFRYDIWIMANKGRPSSTIQGIEQGSILIVFNITLKGLYILLRIFICMIKVVSYKSSLVNYVYPRLLKVHFLSQEITCVSEYF